MAKHIVYLSMPIAVQNSPGQEGCEVMARFFLAATLTRQRAEIFNYRTIRPARLILAAYDRGDESRTVRDYFTPSSLLPEDRTSLSAVYAVTSLFDSTVFTISDNAVHTSGSQSHQSNTAATQTDNQNTNDTQASDSSETSSTDTSNASTNTNNESTLDVTA